MNLTNALKGIGNWKPKPLVAPPPVVPDTATPPSIPAAHAPIAEKPTDVAALDNLIAAAMQSISAGNAPSVSPELPHIPLDCPTLVALHDDLSLACAEVTKVRDLPSELVAFQSELERFNYPAGFFNSELLPLITPNHAGLVFKVLRIEAQRVVLIAPTGDENSLYHPAHNPGLGG
ncbi:MAG: hypothetical protein WCT04_14090 [Planctomycetota bacterium]